MLKVALYLRTSHDERTTENQRLALAELATRRGWQVVHVAEDQGISGAKSREDRPAFDDLLKRATRREFDLVAAWSVDRLGRSLADLLDTLRVLHAATVGLYLHQQAIDTTSPSGRAMFQMLGVFAEFEREMIRARVRAGLARAKASGRTLGRRRGSRGTLSQLRERTIAAALEAGERHVSIATRLGLSVRTVERAAKQARLQSSAKSDSMVDAL
jgi:DNA invertase Pin-like site-specific DNA recombinase